MIDGTTHHPLRASKGTKMLTTRDGQAVWLDYWGPRMLTADLSSEVPEIREHRQLEGEQIEAIAALGGGRWAVVSWLSGVSPVQSRVRWARFEDLGSLGDQPAVTVPGRFSFAHGVSGHLLLGTYNVPLSVVRADGELVPVVTEPPFSTETEAFTLPDGRDGLLFGGDAHTFDGQNLERVWTLGVAAEPAFKGEGAQVCGPVATVGDDIFTLDAMPGAFRGGRVVHVRADGSREKLHALGDYSGLLGLPEGALLAIHKRSKTKYGRVLFIAEGKAANLSPKALGSTAPLGAAFWDPTHERLCVFGPDDLITVPWSGIRAETRRKL